MSSRMFQGVLLQLSEAAQTTIGVIDAEGNVISCSDTTLIGEKWPDAATAVAAMLENPVREEPYTFYALKGWNPAYGYSAFVLGTDAQAESLVRMTQVSLNSAKAYYVKSTTKGPSSRTSSRTISFRATSISCAKELISQRSCRARSISSGRSAVRTWPSWSCCRACTPTRSRTLSSMSTRRISRSCVRSRRTRRARS